MSHSEWTAEALIAFEREIADIFNAGTIRAPVHLSGGNELQILEVFQDIKDSDFVTTNWRSHYHCLLKGVPPERLKADILAGKSIALCYPEHRIVASAIVGGTLPIALGIALSIKRSGGANKVWAFLGDMTARTGTYHECVQYASGHDLPITFVHERNGLSVCTDTDAVWGASRRFTRGDLVRGYSYKLPWPHSGAGRRIEF